MRIDKKLKEGKPLNENLINRFIDSFIDAYKKGVQKQFIEKSAERSPILAQGLEQAAAKMDDIIAHLKKLDAQNPNRQK